MNTNNFIATAQTTIDAALPDVWDAFVKPETIKQYMFGTTVITDWKVGSPITWKGEWKGKPYEDKGIVTAFEPFTRLQYTHFSPMAGKPDVPENQHTITITFSMQHTATKVVLQQDNNATPEERQHAEQNWSLMLEGVKKVFEQPKA